MSHSLIKGHLGVENCHFGDIITKREFGRSFGDIITKREFGRSFVNIISVSFDWALRNILFNYLIDTSP